MAARYTRIVSKATTNLTQLVTYPGRLDSYVIINTNAAARYVKFYDTVAPVVGTTVPAITLLIPATTQVQLDFANGVFFGNGMWLATTVNIADSDTTAVGAGDLYINLFTE
jgi:hypothetical protein